MAQDTPNGGDTASAPVVSVGIPVFNNMESLPGVVERVLGQTHKNLEVLLADNGSTDGSAETCRRLADAHDVIRYLPSEQNNGSVWNFDRLLRAARGEFFAWAAPDDVWHSGYLARCFQVLQDDPSTVLVHALQQSIDGEGVERGIPDHDIENLELTRRLRWRASMRHLSLHAAIYGVMRTAVALDCRPLQPVSGGDWVFVAEMSLRGQIRQLPEILFWKTVPGGDVPHRSARELHLLLTGDSRNGLKHLLPYAEMTRSAWQALGYAAHHRAERRSLRSLTVAAYVTRGRWLRDGASLLRHAIGVRRYHALRHAFVSR